MEEKERNIERLLRFAESFHELFPRASQVRWLGFYLWGLLEAEGRRNVDSIARALPKSVLDNASAPAQALQHLLSKSEWDENALLQNLRSRIGWIGESGSCWVIHDAVFLKRGKRSAGVHRQYLRGLGQKANCQTAVMISQVGPSGYFPLAIRLYLPGGWLQEADPLQLAAIPETCRQSFSRDAIALQLLESLAKEPNALPPTVVVTNGYASSLELENSVASLGLALVRDERIQQKAERGQEWLKHHLGLHHFEGRSWRGWHRHAAAVILSFGYLATEQLPRLSKSLNLN